MLEGRDSAFAPNDAQLAAFYAQGVRVFGGYIKLGNDGIYNGWSSADFARVRAHGMLPVAYFSGFDDPATVRGVAESWNIPLWLLDDESGLRPDGLWVQAELDAASAGLYGNAQYHNGRHARVHQLAAYPTSGDPGGEPWPSWLPRPERVPCGWQWAGSHSENNLTVDSAWWDDGIVTFGAGSGFFLGGDLLNTSEKEGLINSLWVQFSGRTANDLPARVFDGVQLPAQSAQDVLTNGDHMGRPGTAQMPDDGSNYETILSNFATAPAIPEAGIPSAQDYLASLRAKAQPGPKGDPGPQGPAGKDGAKGADGTSPDPTTVENGILQRMIDALKRALGL